MPPVVSHYYDIMTEAKIIRQFLNKLEIKSTIRSYKTALENYFTVLEVEDPDTYLDSNRDYKNDVEKFCKTLDHVAPGTFTSRLAAVKRFFNECGINFPVDAVRDYKKKNIGSTPSRTKDIRHPIFTKAELRTMLQHANLRQRSLFLTLASSGSRVGEALQLMLDDIDFDNDPVLITVRGGYHIGQEFRITFLSDESAECVKEWLKVRGQYLKKVSHSVSNIPKMKGIAKTVDDKRVFPYSTNTAQKMLQKMLRDSGFADEMENGYRYKYHLHTFRKFFYSNLFTSMMPDAVVAYLMGRFSDPSTKDLHLDTKTLGEWYKKAMPSLTIFESANLTDTEKQLNEQAREYAKIEQESIEMQKKIIMLENKIIDMQIDVQRKNTRLDQEIQKIMQLLGKKDIK